MYVNKADRMCILYDRECIDCGECDRCDLDSEKICDNCMKCLSAGEADGIEYRAIRIDGVLTDEERLDSEQE